jgi:uncharacterized membrane protein
MLHCTVSRDVVVPMQHRWVHRVSGHRHEWLSKQNCSLTPAQLAFVFAALSGLSLAIAGLFALSGAWMVLPFALVEVSALGIAFVFHARHATDYERIVLSPEGLLVEISRASRLIQQQCVPAWIRVEYTGRRRELIALVSADRRIEVGRFVPESERSGLARQLRSEMQFMRS